MAFEIKQTKIKEPSEIDPTKRGELSVAFGMEQTEEKDSKKKSIPLYNIDTSKYPQKDTLNLAIQKVNLYFKERSEVYLFSEIRTENKEQFYKDGGMIDWEKVYGYYVDLFYRDPEEIM